MIKSKIVMDHDDVIWDSSKSESFGKQGEKMR
jgi:hypothetical protein